LSRKAWRVRLNSAMRSHDFAPPPPRGDAGLCSACRHARGVGTRTGSSFVLCNLSATDASFARYPRLPVVACPGYERGTDVPPAPDVGKR